jgi:hypothetical protein
MEWASLVLLLHERSTYIVHHLFIGSKWYNTLFACKYRMRALPPSENLTDKAPTMIK